MATARLGPNRIPGPDVPAKCRSPIKYREILNRHGPPFSGYARDPYENHHIQRSALRLEKGCRFSG